MPLVLPLVLLPGPPPHFSLSPYLPSPSFLESMFPLSQMQVGPSPQSLPPKCRWVLHPNHLFRALQKAALALPKTFRVGHRAARRAEKAAGVFRMKLITWSPGGTKFTEDTKSSSASKIGFVLFRKQRSPFQRPSASAIVLRDVRRKPH